MHSLRQERSEIPSFQFSCLPLNSTPLALCNPYNSIPGERQETKCLTFTHQIKTFCSQRRIVFPAELWFAPEFLWADTWMQGRSPSPFFLDRIKSKILLLQKGVGPHSGCWECWTIIVFRGFHPMENACIFSCYALCMTTLEEILSSWFPMLLSV